MPIIIIPSHTHLFVKICVHSGPRKDLDKKVFKVSFFEEFVLNLSFGKGHSLTISPVARIIHCHMLLKWCGLYVVVHAVVHT